MRADQLRTRAALPRRHARRRQLCARQPPDPDAPDAQSVLTIFPGYDTQARL